MKRIVLILAMICATIANASAQEILKEVKRLEKQAETLANDTTKNLNERKIACFKYDAISLIRAARMAHSPSTIWANRPTL